MRPPRLLAVVLVGLAALSACDAGSSPATTKKAASTPDATEWTVTHILIAANGSPAAQHRGKILRSKAVAKQVAQSLIDELAAGRSFDELLSKFTNDVDKDGKPNTNNGKPGSYTFGPKDNFVEPFKKAARETPVGKVAPEPVETDFGYHVIRRDK